jgi:glycosyltransferase involved in cell wall biosynthesis
MKILIITQAVDSKNTTLGFFVRFIEEFAKRTEKTTVICLEKGDFVLPKNINIFSLGKEQIKSRWNYLKNFFKLIFKTRKDYDTVFVHMNQEYIILGFLFWKIFRKKIFLWRNHPYGNFITRIAVKMSDVVFATSNQAYVSKFDKTKIMPVGVDKRIFKTDDSNREVGSILVFGRIAPVKRIEMIIDTFANLLAKGLNAKLNIVGDFLEKDKGYYQIIKERIKKFRIEDFVYFRKAVPFKDAPFIYQKNDIFVNFTKAGSFDKTIVEAMSCGCKVLTTNPSLSDILPENSFTLEDESSRLNKMEKLLSMSSVEKTKYREDVRSFIEYHSLDNLVDKIIQCINQ